VSECYELAKHIHAHIDVSGGGLVCRVKDHSQGGGRGREGRRGKERGGERNTRSRKMYYHKEPRGSKIAHENKTGKKRFKTPGYERKLCSLTSAGLADSSPSKQYTQPMKNHGDTASSSRVETVT
jgi:hypothetical protein